MKLLHEEIKKSIEDAMSLSQIAKITTSILKKHKNKGVNRIGYVAGIVTSGGEKRLQENINNLDRYTKRVRKKSKFPIFSSTDMFDERLVYNLEELSLPPNEVEKKFWEFWRIILKSGYITDIFMTPGWEISKGAQDEYNTAKKIGLTIHYLV